MLHDVLAWSFPAHDGTCRDTSTARSNPINKIHPQKSQKRSERPTKVTCSPKLAFSSKSSIVAVTTTHSSSVFELSPEPVFIYTKL